MTKWEVWNKSAPRNPGQELHEVSLANWYLIIERSGVYGIENKVKFKTTSHKMPNLLPAIRK